MKFYMGICNMYIWPNLYVLWTLFPGSWGFGGFGDQKGVGGDSQNFITYFENLVSRPVFHR